MKTAFITGVGQGIGCALAKRFLEEGWRVIGTTMDAACAFSDEHMEIIGLDLRDATSIAACAKQMDGKVIDVLVNNAGVLLDENETLVKPELLRSTLEVNLIGAADLTERLLPLVPSDGHIIFISSTAGSLDKTGRQESHFPGHYPAYKISKAALNMYMRTLAMRLSETGPLVSSVHPGWVRTAMGGENGELSPEEAAADIFAFAVSKPETGGFWYQGAPLPW